jgi:hypothetical protein
MGGKSALLSGLVLTLLGFGAAWGQAPNPPEGDGKAPPSPTKPEVAPAPTQEMPAPEANAQAPLPYGNLKWSNKLFYPGCPDCFGPVGANGPIGIEAYVRSGVAFPTGGGVLGTVLDPGWQIEVGARSLFFNTTASAAWTIDFGISNTHFNANNSAGANPSTLFNVRPGRPSINTPPQDVTGTTTPATTSTGVIPVVDVTVSGYNQTFANLALGREWFLLRTTNCGHTESNWRAGFDVGGGWGTAKLDSHDVSHQTDTLGRFFVAVHTDAEVPWCGCIYQFGLRAEYNMTWDEILQPQNNSNLQCFSILGTFGIRF